MAEENAEIYNRLNRLEQEMHTLKFRVESVDDQNLPTRVANLELAVKNMSHDAAKIGHSVEDMTNILASVSREVLSIKSWGKGISFAVATILVIINLFPVIKGWFQ